MRHILHLRFIICRRALIERRRRTESSIKDYKLLETPPPRVFISYSHDTPEHKQWVAKLATRLTEEKGIEVILDQWDMSLGSDLGHFMEHGLTTADRVLVICTPTYCKKATDGRGGVGYEKIILTAELIRNTQTDKFIPVIRVADGDPVAVVPTCLGTRLFIDLRADVEAAFDDLARDIHRMPANAKPRIGKNPYAQTATGTPISAVPTPALLPTAAQSKDPIAVYDQAIALARSKDFIGWRLLARDVRFQCLVALTACRQNLDDLIKSGKVRQQQGVSQLMDVGMAAVAPMFAMALAGVESGLPEIERQEAVLDEVIGVSGWQRSGYKILSNFPVNLGFMYHYLHGAMAMQVGKMELAMELARSSIQIPEWRERAQVCRHHGLTGWTPVFESHVVHSWRYLQNYVKNQSWIAHCFGSSLDVLAAIAAYGYALTVDEVAHTMAWSLRSDGTWKPDKASFVDIKPAVPLFFAVDDDPVPQRGYQLFLRTRKQIPGLWQYHAIPDHLMPTAWESWIRGSAAWMEKVNYHQFHFDSPSSLPHALLMVALGIDKNRPFKDEDQ